MRKLTHTRKELEDKGTSIGGSAIWKINTRGVATGEKYSNFLVFSYSHSNLKRIGIDNYSLQWKIFLSKLKSENFSFFNTQVQ